MDSDSHALCRACGRHVAAVCLRYTDSLQTRNAIVALRTEACSPGCADASAKLLGYRKGCDRMAAAVGGVDGFRMQRGLPTERGSMHMVAYTLRRRAWYRTDVADLRWLYRHCRGHVRLWEIENWAFSACPDWTMRRLLCFRYLLKWSLSQPGPRETKRLGMFWKSVDQRVKRCEAACTIQKSWREAICNPTYAFCRTRLMREFGDLLTE